MAGHPQFSFSADAQDTDSSARLLSYQTVMACVSDMDISHIYPQMQADPGSLMHSLAAWDPERLLWISKWRSGKDNSKEVVRNYARAVLALADLHQSAQSLSLPACSQSGQNSTRSAPRTSKTVAATVLEDTSSHALAPRKRPAPQRDVSLVAGPCGLGPADVLSWTARFKPRFSWAPSARVLSVLRNWAAVFHGALDLALLLLQWLPVVIMFAGIAILLTDPMLCGTLLWELLKLVPFAIRGKFAPSSTPVPQFVPQPRLIADSASFVANLVEPPPAFSHPSFATEPTPLSPYEIIMWTLFAESGGAGAVFWLLSRNGVAGGA